MEVIAKIVSAAMVSVFVQNAIFDRAFGSNVGIYASRKNSTVIGFTLGITAMTTLASIVSFFVDQAMLPTEFGWLFMPLIYSAVISVLYILGLLGLWRFFPKIFRKIRKYVHLAIFNCAVIGDKILRIFRGYPIMLVYIGVISLAFYALAGYTVDF